MSVPAPICTHVKTNGIRCGSPAMKGIAMCFHHSAVKTALGKRPSLQDYQGYPAIPFVFVEDRASMQINYYLLLQAVSEQRVDPRVAPLMFRMLRAMDRNLGKRSLDDGETSVDGGQQESVPETRDMEHPAPQVEVKKKEAPFISRAAQAAMPVPAGMERREKPAFDPTINIAASAFQKNPTPSYLSMDEVVAKLAAMKMDPFPSSVDLV